MKQQDPKQELDPKLKLIALLKNTKTGDYTLDLIPYFVEQAKRIKKLEKDVEKLSHIENIDLTALGDTKNDSNEPCGGSKGRKY